MADDSAVIINGRQITIGEFSPLQDYPLKTWNKDDVRFYTGPSSNLKYWKCLYPGTPGGWEAYYSLDGTILSTSSTDGGQGQKGDKGDPGEKGDPGRTGFDGSDGYDGIDGMPGRKGKDAIIAQTYFNLFLSYGREDGVGTLAAFGTGGEGTPDFYLRPNTDMDVLTTGTGSPGEVWEYEVSSYLQGELILDIYVYQCLITPQPSTVATITASVTKNTISVLTSTNLDGISGAGARKVFTLPDASYIPGDRIGIHIETTNFSSGTLMMTAHIKCKDLVIAANSIVGEPGPAGTDGSDGTNGIDAFTLTTASFTQPAVGFSATVNVQNTAWIGLNQTLYLETGGYYVANSIISSTQLTLLNNGATGNATSGTTIATTKKLSPGGIVGPTGGGGGAGTNGVNAFTLTTSSFTQPTVSSTVVIPVLNSTWIGLGQIIYVVGGGYYEATALPTTTSVTLLNLGYAGNATPAATVTTNRIVSPGGLIGVQGLAGTNGTNGTNGATGATGAPGTNGTNGSNGATGATGAAGPIISSMQFGGYISPTGGISGSGLGTLTQPVWLGQGKDDISNSPIEWPISYALAVGATRFRCRINITQLAIVGGGIIFDITCDGTVVTSTSNITAVGVYDIPTGGGYVTIPGGTACMGLRVRAGTGYTAGTFLDSRATVQLEA